MNYLQNHVFCLDSNWGEEYLCRHLVTIYNTVEEDFLDWNSIIDNEAEKYFDEEGYERAINGSFSDIEPERVASYFTKPVPNLKPHVFKWLEANVKDREKTEPKKGWCIGSTKYRNTNSVSYFSVFFHRKHDAMAFIKNFSRYKKPLHYCQYFTDIRKELDKSTGKYILVK